MSRAAVCLERTDFASQSKPPFLRFPGWLSMLVFAIRGFQQVQVFKFSFVLQICCCVSHLRFLYIYISFHSLFRLRLIIMTRYNSAAFYPSLG